MFPNKIFKNEQFRNMYAKKNNLKIRFVYKKCKFSNEQVHSKK